MAKTKSENFATLNPDKIHKAVTRFMLELNDSEYTGLREPEFRASSLPYCPLLFSLHDGTDHQRFENDFYFKTGHAIHELIQKHGPRIKTGTDHMYGDWVCSGCGREAKSRHKPNVCRCHNQNPTAEWLYKELEIKWKKFSGHVDTLLRVARNPDRYVVIDYKTLFWRFGGQISERSKLPYATNVFQIESYCALLRVLLGLNIVGWSLVYINRSEPIKGGRQFQVCVDRQWTKNDHDVVMARLEWANKAHTKAEKLRNSTIKTQSVDKNLLRDTIAVRPCRTQSGWEDYMKPKFKYENPAVCEHLDKCRKKTIDDLIPYFKKALLKVHA